MMRLPRPGEASASPDPGALMLAFSGKNQSEYSHAYGNTHEKKGVYPNKSFHGSTSSRFFGTSIRRSGGGGAKRDTPRSGEHFRLPQTGGVIRGPDLPGRMGRPVRSPLQVPLPPAFP